MSAQTPSTDFFFEAKPRLAAKVGAGGVASIDATTIPHTFVGLDEGDAYIVTVNRTDAGGTTKNPASQTETFIGKVSGTNFINCIRQVEGTAQAWAADTVLELLMTATGFNKLIEGIETEHNQDGTHKAATVTTLKATGAEVTAGTSDVKIVTPKALADAGIAASASPNGWVAAGETWVYVSADDPTFTFKITGVDLTSKYSVGMKIKLTQTTVKYFIITAVAFSTDTTITVYGGTDYDLVSAAITLPYYSTVKAPQGFPVSPIKWTVEATDTNNASQATPTQNAWYNIGSVTISIPIGVWDLSYQVYTMASINSATDLVHHKTTLSTANNSESDADFTVAQYQQIGSANQISAFTANRRKIVLAAAKTSYYLNASVTIASVASMAFRGDTSKTIVRAICAYL